MAAEKSPANQIMCLQLQSGKTYCAAFCASLTPQARVIIMRNAMVERTAESMADCNKIREDVVQSIFGASIKAGVNMNRREI